MTHHGHQLQFSYTLHDTVKYEFSKECLESSSTIITMRGVLKTSPTNKLEFKKTVAFDKHLNNTITTKATAFVFPLSFHFSTN